MISVCGRRHAGILLAAVLTTSCTVAPVTPVAPVAPVSTAPNAASVTQGAAPSSSETPPLVLSVPPPTPPDKVPLGPLSKQENLRSWIEQQDRLYRVAAPLLLRNVELCRDRVRKILGVTAKNKYSYTDDFMEAASSLGFDERLRVVTVLPGSGAERAGIEQGDLLLVTGIEPLPTGPDAERGAAALIDAELRDRDTVHMTVAREQERITTDVPLTSACAFAIELGDTDQPASYSDARRILITRGMVSKLRDDTELAYAVAAEMARSLTSVAADPTITSSIDLLHVLHTEPVAAALPAPSPAALQQNVAAWTPVALELLERAGYSSQGAQTFWQRAP